MTLYKCNQADCGQPGLYRYTWPGRDEAHICELHVEKLRGVAQAMGLHLQIISPLEKPGVNPPNEAMDKKP